MTSLKISGMPPLAVIGVLLCLTAPLFTVDAKVFSHCELARELRRLQIPESQLATWVCIAHYESRLNTSAISGTGDHGIFQISEEYWCSPPGRGKGCGLSCASLEDDDISNDVACIQTIYEEHQDLSGNGFTAWAVYPRCKTSSANRFLKTCSAGSVETDNDIDSPPAPPLDLRFSGNPSHYASKPADSPSYFKSSAYTPSQDYAYTRTSVTPSFDTKPSTYTPSQDFAYTRTSVTPSFYTKPSTYTPSQDYAYSRPSVTPSFYTKPSVYTPSQNYQYTRPPLDTSSFYSSPSHFGQVRVSGAEQNPNRAYTFSNTFQTSPRSMYTPSPQIVFFGPSKSFTTAKPSSYSVGSIYYKPGAPNFDEESSTSSPTKVYSYTPTKSYSTPVSPSFNRGVPSYTQHQSTTASPQYKWNTRSDAAGIKTSSPASVPIRAPWEDFPWWNGGKRKYT